MKRTMGSAGEHNDAILREAGYTAAQIAELRSARVI
jgi:crotonobetainyl-CoA:carnitine CoA-transferase CaiB-like acyl-CoA transferase